MSPMTEPQDVLAEALRDVDVPTPSFAEYASAASGLSVQWESWAEALLVKLAARGYALVRTPETLDDTAGIDADGLCGECGHDENEHVHYCSHDDRSSCDCNAEYVRLAAAALRTSKPEGEPE